MNERHFEEVQTFPWWAYALLFGSGIAPLLLLLVAPWATGRDIEVGLPALRSLVALLPVWLVLGNLLCMRTILQADTITVSFGWLVTLYRRVIPLREIAYAEAVRYNPLAEFGGWGIRGAGENQGLNAQGDRGVRVRLRDGRRILIGSRRAEELAEAIGRQPYAP